MTSTEQYEDVIASTESLDPLDEWENIMMLLYRMHARKATRHPEAAPEPIQKFPSIPSAITDGWRGWNTAMAYLQLGDLDAAIKGFAAPGAFDEDVPDASHRGNVAWFWSLIAEGRG